MKIELEQGSEEWQAHRMRYRNASETPAVMGASPWVTPYQLWLQRTERTKQETTYAMRRGIEMEPAARAAYEALTGNQMQPVVMVDGEYSASLDGLSWDESVLLEAKCPVKGADSETWLEAASGRIPEHYRWQIQHQLMVSRADVAHFWVFDGQRGVLVEERPDSSMWARLHEHWEEFMRLVIEDTPPALVSGDVRDRTDYRFQSAVEAFIVAKQAAEEAEKALAEARNALLGLSAAPMEKGFGVQVTRFWKAGSIDYKSIPALKGMNLEKYRSKSREETRITIQKGEM